MALTDPLTLYVAEMLPVFREQGIDENQLLAHADAIRGAAATYFDGMVTPREAAQFMVQDGEFDNGTELRRD